MCCKLIGRKNIAWSSLEIVFEPQKVVNALVCFAPQKKAIVREEQSSGT